MISLTERVAAGIAAGFVAVLLPCLLPGILQAGTVMKPNIVIVVADDMGWGELRAYNPDSLIAMPNLERLAAEGIRFTDAHTSASMCAPTRYSILTGNYHWRGRQPWGTWNYHSGSQILGDQTTLGEVLQAAGYKTAMFGKSHLGASFFKKDSDEFVQGNEPEDQIDFARRFVDGPLDHGFDYSFVLPRGIQKSPYAHFENDKMVGDADEVFLWTAGDYGSSTIDFDGLGMPYWDSSEVGPTLAAKAVEFIDRHHQDNLENGTSTPFFLYYASQAGHVPFTPPANFLGEQVQGVTAMGDHSDMIYELDVALGSLTGALEQRGLLENTLIIFTDDNGGNPVRNSLGHDSQGGLRGVKGDIWEGGHRVPLVAKWGDGTVAGSTVGPGKISDQLIGVHDLVATLTALVGESLPAGQARDSFNFLPVLLGDGAGDTPVRDHLIMESPTDAFVWYERQFAFRQGEWKLELDKDRQPSGLYNLTLDLAETNNRIMDANQAGRVMQMHDEFERLFALERTAPLSDIDSDGVIDEVDNCLQVANGPLISDTGGNVQLDTDKDGIGNACDADLNQDCAINFFDLATMKAVMFSTDPHADLDGNGSVDFDDLAIMKASFFGVPGPSGLPGTCVDASGTVY